MFWLLVLSTAFLGIGVVVFVLTRDSFRASRNRRETPLAAYPVEKNSDTTAINTMMQEKLPAPPPSHPAALFSGQNGKEADDLADTLTKVSEKTNLPSGAKAYLRLEEHDDTLDRLLIRRAGGQRAAGQAQPKEFSIGVTEKKEPPLEHEK